MAWSTFLAQDRTPTQLRWERNALNIPIFSNRISDIKELQSSNFLLLGPFWQITTNAKETRFFFFLFFSFNEQKYSHQKQKGRVIFFILFLYVFCLFPSPSLLKQESHLLSHLPSIIIIERKKGGRGELEGIFLMRVH